MNVARLRSTQLTMFKLNFSDEADNHLDALELEKEQKSAVKGSSQNSWLDGNKFATSFAQHGPTPTIDQRGLKQSFSSTDLWSYGADNSAAQSLVYKQNQF